MLLGGASVSFYHVMSWYIRWSPVSEPQTLVKILDLDFKVLAYTEFRLV